MGQILYTLQFTGAAAPANDQGTVLNAKTKANMYRFFPTARPQSTSRSG